MCQAVILSFRSHTELLARGGRHVIGSVPFPISATSGNLGLTWPNHGKPLVDKAVIVGGGLGGLATALQLRKIGIDAHVYERHSKLSGGAGTMIGVAPNGCKALNEANPDVVSKMREVGLIDPESTSLLRDGTIVGKWDLVAQMEKRFGQPMIVLLWRDALTILSEALPKDCIHTGYECFDLSQEEDGDVVHFKKENEVVSVKAPLVIGADGIKSVIRSKLFGNIQPRDTGRALWRAVTDSHLSTHKLMRIGILGSGFDGYSMFIINGVRGKLYWSFSVKDECNEGTGKIRSKDQIEAKERILGYTKGWDLATHVIEITDPELILERRILEMPVLPNWSKGSTVLLGDAVHAISPAIGQGANMAFEDGLQLALMLMDCPDLQTALKAYEELRIPRAKRIFDSSQSTLSQASDEFNSWLYNYLPTTHYNFQEAMD